MKRIKEFVFSHKKIIILLIVYTMFLSWYAHLPDYKQMRCYTSSYTNYCKSTLDVKIYKPFAHYYLYQEIENDYRQLNEKPNKLIINLYIFNWNYRTVIFDYDNHMEYILVDSI